MSNQAIILGSCAFNFLTAVALFSTQDYFTHERDGAYDLHFESISNCGDNCSKVRVLLSNCVMQQIALARLWFCGDHGDDLTVCWQIVDARGDYSVNLFTTRAQKVISEHDSNKGPWYIYLVSFRMRPIACWRLLSSSQLWRLIINWQSSQLTSNDLL